MLWCPKCELEFKEGVEYCKTCNTKLIVYPGNLFKESNDSKENNKTRDSVKTSNLVLWTDFIFEVLGIIVSIMLIIHFMNIDGINTADRRALLIIFSITLFISLYFSVKKCIKIKIKYKKTKEISTGLAEVISWYKENHQIVLEKQKYLSKTIGLDEGERGLVVIKEISNELTKQFKYFDSYIIESAAEEIYGLIMDK